MDEAALFPFADDTAWLVRHAKLPLHTGVGRVFRHGHPDHPFMGMVHKLRQAIGQADLKPEEQEFAASFFVPTAGNGLVFLQWSGEGRLSRNFGEGLTVAGDSPDGSFSFICPQYYVKAEGPGWAVASPVEQPATVSYGAPRAVTTVTATINNFDFNYGNVYDTDTPGRGKVLRVVAAGRRVDFEWRSGRAQLRRLVDAGLIGTTSFVTFSFTAWPGASDEELIAFAQSVSSLCCYVVGQHTDIPVLSFFDAAGRVVRRSIKGVIQSKFRADCALKGLHAESGLPQLFSQCFEEHCRMQQSELWRRLPPLYAAIEDPPYLEQKYATLMMAVELFIRSSLIDGGHLTPGEEHAKELPKLIGMARRKLGWDFPRHYTEGERYRTTRNAVAHGGALHDDIDHVRADFDKWKLFLLRRLFIKLGFDGTVASPQDGWASSSPVDEFSEEHNSFRL